MHPLWIFLAVDLSIGFILYLVVHWVLKSPLKKFPYPPGPPSKGWISGHAKYFQSPSLWLTYANLATSYGNVMHFEAYGEHTVVLSSLDDAIELLEKRSNNYSDRPFIPMIDIMGWTYATGFKPYNSDWHQHRRFFQQTFRPSAALKYRGVQTDKINQMLYNFLQTPADFRAHIRTLSAAIVMSVTYGHDIASTGDRFVSIAEDALTALSQSTFPGAAAVNVLPLLRFLPSCFPRVWFKTFGESVQQLITEMKLAPYEQVARKMMAGTALPCLVSSLLDTCKSEKDHQILQEVAATVYAAGADTTSSSIATFIYIMITHPDIQKRAQKEIDRVVGSNRLPNYDDQLSLPYVQALYREVLRFKPVLPLCGFHSTMSDDVYKGFYIPKGTTVVPNIWAMSRDPLKYKDPEQFNPDRYFKDGCSNQVLNDDDVSYVFGFGRRICPGRHMAAATVWLAIATLLSTFDMRPSKDENGKDAPLTGEYTDGLIIHPAPFKCDITPRSEKAKQLIVDASSDI